MLQKLGEYALFAGKVVAVNVASYAAIRGGKYLYSKVAGALKDDGKADSEPSDKE